MYRVWSYSSSTLAFFISAPLRPWDEVKSQKELKKARAKQEEGERERRGLNVRGAKIKSQKVSRESRPARNSPPRIPEGPTPPQDPSRTSRRGGPIASSASCCAVSSKCPANQQESLSGVKDSALILDGVLRDGGDTWEGKESFKRDAGPMCAAHGIPHFPLNSLIEA